jgi:hypothetical protein
MKATINHKIIELVWQKMHVARAKKLTMMMLFWPKKTILWLLLHHLVIIHYCFGGLLHLNVSGALEVMDICHFQLPKFNILFHFDSFKNTTRWSLELPTINSLLSLVAMKTFVWLIGVFGFDWDREWHQHHGSWCMKSIAARVHLCPQRIGRWSLEKCLLHGNVLVPCNRLSISTEMYS